VLELIIALLLKFEHSSSTSQVYRSAFKPVRFGRLKCFVLELVIALLLKFKHSP
jgi:hypothetical protein